MLNLEGYVNLKLNNDWQMSKNELAIFIVT